MGGTFHVKHKPVVYNGATGVFFEVDHRRQRMSGLRRSTYWATKALENAQREIGGKLVMYTLTYRPDVVHSNTHMGRFMDWLRTEQGDPLYCWVAELQKRGAVHYHVLALLPKGITPRSPSKNRRSKIGTAWGWPYGRTHILRGVKYPHYIQKYISKGDDGDGNEYPANCRTFGACHKRLGNYLSSDDIKRKRVECYPTWAIECAVEASAGDAYCRVRGGFSIMGELALSPYSVVTRDQIRDRERSEVTLTSGDKYASIMYRAQTGVQLPLHADERAG